MEKDQHLTINCLIAEPDHLQSKLTHKTREKGLEACFNDHHNDHLSARLTSLHSKGGSREIMLGWCCFNHWRARTQTIEFRLVALMTLGMNFHLPHHVITFKCGSNLIALDICSHKKLGDDQDRLTNCLVDCWSECVRHLAYNIRRSLITSMPILMIALTLSFDPDIGTA